MREEDRERENAGRRKQGFADEDTAFYMEERINDIRLVVDSMSFGRGR